MISETKFQLPFFGSWKEYIFIFLKQAFIQEIKLTKTLVP